MKMHFPFTATSSKELCDAKLTSSAFFTAASMQLNEPVSLIHSIELQ